MIYDVIDVVPEKMHSMILELNCQEQHGSSPLIISYLNLAEFGRTGPYLENTCVFCFLWNNIELRPPINRKGRTVFVPIVSILNAIKDFSLKDRPVILKKVRQRDSFKRLVSDLKGFLMTVAYNTAVALRIPFLFQNKLVFKCYRGKRFIFTRHVTVLLKV